MRKAFSPLLAAALSLFVFVGIYVQLMSPRFNRDLTTSSELFQRFLNATRRESWIEYNIYQEGMLHGQNEQKAERIQKKFAYFVLTEQCLPAELLGSHALGDSNNLDVYVNSYRGKCENNPHTHIKYIFDKNTTWTTGRNMLYYHVKKSKKRYLYHIFLDDDVALIFTEHMIEFADRTKTPRGTPAFLGKYLQDPTGYRSAVVELRNGKSAYRVFEEELIASSPAFSTTNLVRTEGFETRLAQEFYWKKMCSAGKVMPWIAPVYFIDTLFIAYHEEALPLLLPYSLVYEKVNWWISAILQLFRARAILPRQNVCNYKVTVINKSHRPYPHGQIPNDILKKYIETEASELKGHIDERDLDYGVFNSWKKYEETFFGDPSICLSPLKFPITKFYRNRNAE